MHGLWISDPRQFVPANGQTWTTLHKLSSSHKNTWSQDPRDPRIWSFWTEPKVNPPFLPSKPKLFALSDYIDTKPPHQQFAIGQRAFILQTPGGNIMWDMIANLDTDTVARISSTFSPLKAVVISHPHYYTTYASWSARLGVPVYIAADDKEWLCQQPPPPSGQGAVKLNLIEGSPGTKQEILPDVTAIKTGGHFPGSLVLHWEKYLFIADTIVTVPSAHTPSPRPPGQTTYAFQYSIPNAIPLDPDTIHVIWKAIRDLEFEATFGAFTGMEVRDKGLRGRMLESMKVQVRGMGWGGGGMGC
ncbi:MAG: hypothetical protein OHK93_005057 [Ramalina farinacea]|uniref:Metallo-beta-lactamase domain-containing protein n=1 Tax=Ramalina farinacea TaxID=258253 RepID=A0AA43QX44_9LECA|nr:hypothetical protein [Ramalina farinacea]